MDYSDRVAKAVSFFWKVRTEQHKKQGTTTGRKDAGNRSAVTGGKHLDGFVRLLREVLLEAGLPNAAIHSRTTTLPGYFRPAKNWDLVVVVDGVLLASIEFKAHVGPSFGNNFNNRSEEAIGTAHDLWTAYREGALGEDAPRPFLGWVMLLEDCDKSNSPVTDKEPHFPVDPAFKRASYAQRYDILCKRLVQEGLYSSATFLASPRDAASGGRYRHLSELTSLKTFVTEFAGHIAAVAAR